ncbi:hypothetical protein I79_019167 [Cricetulus griseus]|uniref:Uncharacterized protein n=1 Tax=Cricetulus griseus TaxID=10029 RepID=G3I6P0_CRIGR|nr:hypothetical protein I79_019167 [Cricetulus griseus]
MFKRQSHPGSSNIHVENHVFVDVKRGQKRALVPLESQCMRVPVGREQHTWVLVL